MKKISIVFVFLFIACTSTKVSKTPPLPENISITGKIFASLFQQRAAEYRALCFQAFNTAMMRIDESIQSGGRPKAIITDIDETILDNSAYDLHRYLKGVDYEPVSWDEWISMSNADTVPGAAAFLRYAASKGVTIFYISNREEKNRPGTLSNLQKFKLPFSDNSHLVLKQGVSSKEGRRLEVAKNYDIVLLLGDNLADFHSDFDKKMIEERQTLTDSHANDFGKKFILIPNPVYGDWESTVYKYGNKLTAAQKDSAIKSLLKSY